MRFDDFALAGEGEVSSLLPALVQLAKMLDNVGSGKAHPSSSTAKSDQGLIEKNSNGLTEK